MKNLKTTKCLKANEFNEEILKRISQLNDFEKYNLIKDLRYYDYELFQEIDIMDSWELEEYFKNMLKNGDSIFEIVKYFEGYNVYAYDKYFKFETIGNSSEPRLFSSNNIDDLINFKEELNLNGYDEKLMFILNNYIDTEDLNVMQIDVRITSGALSEMEIFINDESIEEFKFENGFLNEMLNEKLINYGLVDDYIEDLDEILDYFKDEIYMHEI